MQRVVSKYKELRSAFIRKVDSLSARFEGRRADEQLTEVSIRRRKIAAHYIYNFLFALLAALSLMESSTDSTQWLGYRAGDVADKDLIAPVTAELQPKLLTKTRMGEVERSLPPIFDYDDQTTQNWLSRWEMAFPKIRKEFYAQKAGKKPGPVPAQLPERVVALSGGPLPTAQLQFLHQNRFSETVERAFLELGRNLLGRLIAPSSLFPMYYNTGIRIRLVNQNFRETLVHDVSRIWSVEQAAEYLDRVPMGRNYPRDFDLTSVVDIVAATLVPNLKFNQTLTQKETAKAVSAAKYSPLTIKRGQLIAKKGDHISEDEAEIIGLIGEVTSGTASVKRFFLSFVLLFVFFSVLFRLNIAGRAFWNLSLKDALVFLTITIGSFWGVRLALPLLRLLTGPLNTPFGVEYLLPISAGGIIIHLMMGKEIAFTFATLNSIVIGYLLDQNFYFTVYAFAVTASAIQSIRACKQRTDLFKCGAWSGLVGALLVASFSLTQSLGFKQIEWSNVFITSGLSFISGMLGAIITSSLIPVFEAVFGYTTSLKLLELSNFNHPLLHSLMMKAPGTYHHSVIVGSLAELAADRIKANSLLARVSAYYHDIGKMNKPLYFIENQTPNDNPHDQLQPSMSAKILFSHVKEGVKLGKVHKLGGSIVHIIEQHHGTTLVSYFFNKAKKSENPDLEHVHEGAFRYPGPKPQTREAAIVMLADACEAATRSISDPTASKIQTMVHNIINKRFLEEQFSDCDLTLQDLHTIEECFVRTLVSLYHHRIEYPGQRQAINRVSPDNAVPNNKRANGNPS